MDNAFSYAGHVVRLRRDTPGVWLEGILNTAHLPLAFEPAWSKRDSSCHQQRCQPSMLRVQRLVHNEKERRVTTHLSISP